MELNLNSQEYHLKKILFNLKTHGNDGLLLRIHHSDPDFGGENKRHRFIHASFNSNGNHLAVCDHRGNVFIINLEMEWFWQLAEMAVPTILSFPISKNHELLVGLDNTSVLLMHIDTGYVISVLKGHCAAPTEVSYSDDGYYYLTSCSTEAIVWDSSTYTQIHKLSLKSEVLLKKVVFMPMTNHILACFQDDTMHVWKFSSFECIKQIVPEAWRTHHLRAIAITSNGRTMVIGGHCPNLIIFCLDTWAIKSVVEFPKSVSGVKQLEFLSQVFDGGANKLLAVLTMSQELVFFDIETLIFFKWTHQSSGLTAKFSLTSNGKYLASVLTSGEVFIYTIEKVLFSKNALRDREESLSLNKNSSCRNYSSKSSRRTQNSYDFLSGIQKEIKTVLDVKKLLPILKQFGEYPQSYRMLIWKTLLQLPENKESFISLSLKKCHPSYIKLEIKYPLSNRSLGNSLKKLLSNISHWCPLFGEVEFLPEFVFPFVKLFHSNPLICFEVVATVIVNWCQNWFEFYPFPPINMLSLLESILGFHDPNLLQFYLRNNITTSVTFCPLFHTAFSEVLSKTEWLKLWDHILSNEPSFFFMAIVAYNVVCQTAVKSLENVVEIEKFFHNQNAVDMKTVISKAYHYLKNTPDSIHTRQFFSPFRSLGSAGTYISFLAYPKLIVDASAEKLQCIRQEKEKVMNEQLQALAMKNTFESRLQHDTTIRDKEMFYQELEEKMRQTVEDEEDRLLTERRKLHSLRQELKLKELQVLETTRDVALDEKIRRKKLELERLLKDISKRKLREKTEIDGIEEEIKNYYSDLLLRKCLLESELGLHNVINKQHVVSDFHRNLEKTQEKLNSDLTALQYECDGLYPSKGVDLSNKITTIKSLISSVELELAKIDISGKNPSKDERDFIHQVKRKVNLLENEVEALIQENLKKLRNEEHQKTQSNLPWKNNNETFVPERKLKNTSRTKSRRTVKYIKKPSAVRKITTVRTRLPGAKPVLPRDDHKTWPGEPFRDLVSNLQGSLVRQGREKVHQPSHMRSKLTWPSDPQVFSPNSHLENLKSLGHWQSGDVLNDSSSFVGKEVHQTSGGDRSCIEKLPEAPKSCKSKKKSEVSKFTIKNEVFARNTGEKIFDSALKTRGEIIEEAKRRQMLQ